MSEAEKTIEQLANEFKKATDQVKGLGEELQGKMANNEKGLNGLKEKVDEALASMNDAKSRLDELEQKATRRGYGVEQEKSIAQRLVDTDDYKSFAADPRSGKSAKLSLKATITSLTTDAAGSAGAAVVPMRLPGIVTPPQRQLTVRDLLMQGTTDSNAITYVREKLFTNNAAAQATEGAKKAQSDLQLEEVTVGVKTLAHYVKASRQILDDAAMLESYINGRLAYGLKLVEDKQLLNGDGSAGGLQGVMNVAQAFADKATMKNYTIIDQLRLAQLQVALADYPASGLILNPIDWAKIELEKDGQGRHIIGNPQSLAQPTLWGIPVVQTQAITAGDFLTGAFNMGAQIFDRQQLGVAVSTENEDDFVKNLVTILCEERLALAIYRPDAFVKGKLVAK